MIRQEVTPMESGTWTNRRYQILTGPCLLPPQSVQVEHDPEWTPAVEPHIREEVSRACAQLREAGRRVEQNPLHLFLDWSFFQGQLVVKTGNTDYEYYLASSSLQLRVPPAVVLCVAAITEVEGGLVVQERSAQVAQGAGMLHVVPSGHVHPNTPGDPRQSAWRAVVQEAKEELDLDSWELKDPLCLGLVKSSTAPVVVLIYRLRIELNWHEVSKRQPTDSWEHANLELLSLEETAMEEWLVKNFSARATGPGHAAVFLEGVRRFGRDWGRRIRSRLE